MKKTLLIIALTILTITAVKSQNKIQFGVKGGINFTNMTSDFIYDKEFKTGFHIGLLAEIPFSSKFSIQPEILYSRQGTKGFTTYYYIPYPGAPTPDPVNSEYKFDYIQIPILAKIYLIKSMSLEIGPSFNFLVNDENITDTSTNTDFGENFEFSLVLGLSYKIKSNFITSVRYTNGFTSAFDNDYIESANYGFQIGLGYLF